MKITRYGASLPLAFPNLDPAKPELPADARRLLEGAQERRQSVGMLHNQDFTAGVLIEGVVPTSWVRYLNLTGVGSFLKHDKLDLKYDGSATFNGIVDVTAASDAYSFSFGNVQAVLRDTDVAHGMTTLTDTDVNGLLATPGTAGGLVIVGLAESTAAAGLSLQGHIDMAGGAAAVAIAGWKKSGTTSIAVAAADILCVFRAGAADKLTVFGDGGLQLNGLLLTVASAAGGAGLRAPHGAAPSSPVNGDMWTTTAGLFVRVNGVTVGPLS